MRDLHQEALAEGVERFNRGDYFAAHEAWEVSWREPGCPQRLFVQGLIQTAAAFHKLGLSAPSGAYKLLGEAIAKLELFIEAPVGVELTPLIPLLARWRELAGAQLQGREAGQEGEPPRPQLVLRQRPDAPG